MNIQTKSFATSTKKPLSRLRGLFDRLKECNGKAFVPFLVIGDPTPEIFLDVIRIVEPFADIIELGIPFSDPVADGPVIQSANQRVLSQKVSLIQVFSLIRKIRAITSKPIVILTYANIVGVDEERIRTLKTLAECGVDGIIVADVPLEEAAPFLIDFQTAGIDMILLVTPTADDDRIRRIVEMAQGFLYMVSVSGTTGARSVVLEETAKTLTHITQVRNLHSDVDHRIPVCVGFGISKPEHVREILNLGADGVIVGSAIISIIEKFCLKPEQMLAELHTYLESMKTATNSYNSYHDLE